jgi:hypothetical protein
MQKLFSTQYGSRLFGTQTPTSDTDLKHIILPDLNSLLLGKRLEHKVTKTNKVAHTRNDAADVDEDFIPIQIFARDFMEGQTYAIEMAFAIEGDHAGQTFHNIPAKCGREMDEASRWYLATGDVKLHPFYVFTRELREQFMTSNIKAMMGYVVNQANLYSAKGERLNVVREVKNLLEDAANVNDEEHRLSDLWADSPAFVACAKRIAAKSKYFKVAEYDIGDGRMMPCFKLLEKTLPFSSSLGHTFRMICAQEAKFGTRADAATVDNVDWKATMHALRIVNEGVTLLSTRKLSFPLNKDEVEHLLAVKAGAVSLDVVTNMITEQLDKLKDLEKTCGLPETSPELNAKFEAWLVSWVRRFYDL